MTDGPLTTSRWRRYGNDRLYVTAVDGTKVGWWDLATDEAHPDSPEDLLGLVAAVESWRAGGVAQETTQTHATPDSPTSPDRGFDLAQNLPGSLAREQAIASKEAAPVKTVLARVLGVHTNERAWRIGAVGEEKVAGQFEKVLKKDARWAFLHAIPVGERGSDIDHVAIGPGGVFTFNAKHHPGAKIWVGGDTLLVNGQKQPYIRNSRHEAQRAARLLSAVCGFVVNVEGVVVPVRAEDLTVKARPDGVHVVQRFQVARWLRRRPEVLDGQTIEAIYEAARWSATWRPTP